MSFMSGELLLGELLSGELLLGELLSGELLLGELMSSGLLSNQHLLARGRKVAVLNHSGYFQSSLSIRVPWARVDPTLVFSCQCRA